MSTSTPTIRNSGNVSFLQGPHNTRISYEGRAIRAIGDLVSCIWLLSSPADLFILSDPAGRPLFHSLGRLLSLLNSRRGE
jgi:hypothetical protein